MDGRGPHDGQHPRGDGRGHRAERRHHHVRHAPVQGVAGVPHRGGVRVHPQEAAHPGDVREELQAGRLAGDHHGQQAVLQHAQQRRDAGRHPGARQRGVRGARRESQTRILSRRRCSPRGRVRGRDGGARRRAPPRARECDCAPGHGHALDVAGRPRAAALPVGVRGAAPVRQGSAEAARGDRLRRPRGGGVPRAVPRRAWDHLVRPPAPSARGTRGAHRPGEVAQAVTRLAANKKKYIRTLS
mmetsp:Transcript_3209/g.12915  ORF Transcript_3209/g.12915 Transcript_3209/m.12915 type:complete len:243 (+) Transcript_3209:1418-2146(+)